MDFFIGFVTLFLIYIYIFFFPPFSLFVSVYVYASFCDFVCIGLLLPFGLGFCLLLLFVCLFVSSFSSEPCGWQGLGALAACWA